MKCPNPKCNSDHIWTGSKNGVFIGLHCSRCGWEMSLEQLMGQQSEIEKLQSRIAELERELACPCCTKGVNMFGEICQECHGTAAVNIAYEIVRTHYKLQSEKIAELERDLDKWKRRYYETQEYWCSCNLTNDKNHYVCELHEKFGDDKEVIGLAQEIDSLQSTIDAQKLEIERLKKELKESEERECSYDPLSESCTKKEREIDRLRGVLREVEDIPSRDKTGPCSIGYNIALSKAAAIARKGRGGE